MRNGIKSKLKNASGVSILFALFGMMVAAMVSAVLVAAALSNAKRAAATKEQTQAYLAAESAATMVKEMLGDCEIIITSEETTSYERISGNAGREPKSETSGCTYDVALKSDNNLLSDMIRTQITRLLGTGSGSSGSTEVDSFTVRVKNDTEDLLPPVEIKVIPGWGTAFEPESGDKTIQISIIVGNESYEYRNAMTIIATGVCSEPNPPVITEGEFEDMTGESEGLQKRVDTIEHTYCLKWEKNKMMVMKGE